MKKLLLILALALSANAWAQNFVELKCKQIDGEQEYLISAPTETPADGIVEDLNRKMRDNPYFAVFPDLIEGRNIGLCQTLTECEIEYKYVKEGIVKDWFTFYISRADLTAKKTYYGEKGRKIVKHFQCEIVEDRRKKNKI